MASEMCGVQNGLINVKSTFGISISRKPSGVLSRKMHIPLDTRSAPSFSVVILVLVVVFLRDPENTLA